MAPKRSSADGSPPTTPSSKRKKGRDAQQPSLSAFLASPRPAVSKVQSPAGATTTDPHDHDEADALFALKLAAREAGVSLSEMRKRLNMAEPHTATKEASEEARSEAAEKQSQKPIHPMFRKSLASESSNVTISERPTQKDDVPTAGPSTLSHQPAPFDFAALDAGIASIDFTQDVFVFDPNLVSTTGWPKASDDTGRATTPYALLSHAFIVITATNSRLLIVTVLTNLMRTIKTLDPDSLIPAIYLITNHIAPSYEDVQLGIGGSITNKAIKSVTGKSARTLKTLWDATGDPGDVAFEAKKDVKPMVTPPPLTVQKVFGSLHVIAGLTHSGAGSTNAKLNQVTKLLVASRGEEARWLVRTFHSHLRIGAVKKTLSSAIARCFSLIEVSEQDEQTEEALLVRPQERKNVLANPTKAKDRQLPERLHVVAKFARAERVVREVLARHPNFTSLLLALQSPGGLPHLSELVPLRIGVPISPMLGSITRSLNDVFTKLGVGTPNARAFVSEFKYDGQRVQIHARRVIEAGIGPDGKLSTAAKAKRKEIDERGKGKWIGHESDIYVRLFSRHLEDMTSKYPDILDLIPELMSRRSTETDGGSVQDSFIMDAEVVAIGQGGENELLPFQTLSNRSRKDVDLKEVKVKVGVFAFDLMYLNGQSLLKSSLRVRRRLLHSHFPPMTPDNPLIARFHHVKSSENTDPEEVERFFQDARAHRCEGIMVKTLDHWWKVDADASNATDDAVVGDTPKDGDVDTVPSELRQLGDVVSDDLVMEEDTHDVGLNTAKTSAGKKRAGRNAIIEDEDGDALPAGKGVSGRGKALLSTYEPDKRCESWLKVKQDYVDGIGDSLDLVPIGAWHGMGRKAQWWSPVLLAIYDEDDDTYYAVTKCISGFTDAEYKSIKFERFPESEEPGASCYNARKQRCRHSFETGGYLPDVWFEPSEVWELRFADITLSPVYPAAKGLVSEERGLSCRFPRFIRRREDKGPHQSTTPSQLAKLYLDQRSNVDVAAPRGEVAESTAGHDGEADGADDAGQDAETRD
ncbi:unnamed protein product [Parajaminaea phylloscopi]